MKIEGSVFLITGGASGLGAATAQHLLKAGASVLLADLNSAGGEALADKLGPKAAFTRTDVVDDSSMQAAVDLAVTRFGALHGVICCAGIAPGEKVLGKEGPHALDSFTRGVMINLVGTFNAVRLAVEAISRNPPNAEGERGVVVMTASVAAFDGQIGQAAYAASKAGVVGMTLPIARELARFGIRVMTIAPGIFETPMLLGLPQDVQDSLGKTVPFPPRLGRGCEFSQLVQSIVENPMLNGEVIRLDGALRMSAK
ncbi:3-hydroxyacyl-CoA dehydrogenase [Pseudomonas putida]|uniref:3-hydroxyacyl-CoA dehydrogenase n=1 Tax=Pseudomonas putida TaxID=303 RepID=UPI0034D5F18B